MNISLGELIFRIFISICFSFLLLLVVFAALKDLTSSVRYAKVDCVDGEQSVNLEGFKCEKKIRCGGFPEFFIEPTECDNSYSKSRVVNAKN